VQLLSFDFMGIYDYELYSPLPVPSSAEGGESSLSEERGNPDCF
jgi:hypothetical protein